MNYKPVVAGNQSNGNAGTKACDDTGKARMETVPRKDYILLPLWTTNPPFSQSSKSSPDDGSKPSSDDEKKVDEDTRKDSENINQEKDDNVNSTNNVNVASINEVNTVDNDEDVGAEADMNNLDTTIQKHPKRAWYETLSTYLLDNRFQRGKIDKTLFIKRDKGLQVKQKNDGIFISQDKYVAEILKKFGFSEVKTASTPMETQKPLLKDEDGEKVDVHLYRSMIGSLMYLTSLRPDIMFAVCAYARYQVNSKVSHLHVMKMIFRYLKGQPKLGLWYPKDSPFDLVAYTNSDYAGASLDRKSTIGGCQFLGCRLISWQCKKQTVVANSIIEAKYVAASICFILNTAGIINIVKIVRKRIERVGENKNRKSDLVSKRIERIFNAARHNLLLLVQVNAARHNLLLLVQVNAVE
ncbi:hypothetical protein Tco_0805963, partial [Tanacetum coccineum]